MNSLAKSLHVLRGALSRWLLPFDHNTRIDAQCSTPHSVLESMPEDFKGKLSERQVGLRRHGNSSIILLICAFRQVHYLVAGANGVRKLVRIKIADDNDLEQARQALMTTNAFFKKLYHQAQKRQLTPFELLKQSGTL
mgnify:CR=1 FL=1